MESHLYDHLFPPREKRKSVPSKTKKENRAPKITKGKKKIIPTSGTFPPSNYIEIDGINISDHVKDIKVEFYSEPIAVQAMGDEFPITIATTTGWNAEVSMYDEFYNASCIELINNLFSKRKEVEIKFVGSTNSNIYTSTGLISNIWSNVGTYCFTIIGTSDIIGDGI